MLRRTNHLPFLVLATLTLILVIGCSQSEDIVTPASTTNVTLNAERLPIPPAGMVYELWVANAKDTVSLGKFLYDNTARRFLDTDQRARTNNGNFVLNGDIYKYGHMFVSVETTSVATDRHPGPIMLIDSILNPNNDPFKLVVPGSDKLEKAALFFNMEGVSDHDSIINDTLRLARRLNDGKGLWFCRYMMSPFSMPDTVRVTIDTFDTLVEDSTIERLIYLCAFDTTGVETTLVHLDTLPNGDPNPYPRRFYLGRNPLRHLGIGFTQVECTTTTKPLQGRYLTVRFDTAGYRQPTELFMSDTVLPDLTPYGWHYKGWVVVNSYNSVPLSSHWRMTPPVWSGTPVYQSIVAGGDGSLFTTGTFAQDGRPGDNYTNDLATKGPTPPYPGRDFFHDADLLAKFGVDSLQLVQSNSAGTVFISLEPNNFPLDTTNFPLIAFTAALPTRAMIQADTVAIPMWNRTATTDGDLYAPDFPQIRVSFKRY